MQDTVAAVILAGGGGRRLGGVDKALLPLVGQPLLTHVLARLRLQTGMILLSANGDPARFDGFDLPVVADAAPDQGPLAGIAAAVAECQRRWPEVRWLATVPVDMPFPPIDLLERLFLAAVPGQAAVAEAGGRMHWTAALWPVENAAALSEQVEAAELRRLQDGLETVGWCAVPFSDPNAFHNVNREEDLETAARLLSDL